MKKAAIQRIIALSILLGLGSGLGLTPVWADKTIKSLKHPIPITLSPNSEQPAPAVGQPFEGVLTETLVYQDQSIPQGTIFKGHIENVKPSRRFTRAGYIALNVDEAVLPSGEVYRFDKEKFEQKATKYHSGKAATTGTLIRDGAPITAASLATSIPLNAATTLSGGVIYAITLGARTLVATGIEVPKQRHAGKAIGMGVARGTGAKTVYDVVKKSPEPQMKAGAVVNLHMDPEWVKGLMQANSDMKQLNTTLNTEKQ